MNLRATQPLDAPEAPAAVGSGMRFVYASGDRPLEGYTIKRGIGRGGFGEVYYALSDGGKEVALKLVCRNLEIELRGVSQCLNIKHPNLLSLYDIRQDDHDESWVVMEYVAGDSLERVIQRHPQGLPIDDVMFWMQGVAAGVGYLHHHGIIHRDLKPGNIFCDEGVVKVGDYGLSKFISCSRRSGQTGSVGTVHYMAPEVANGRYGKEIDIYAMGIMLYEMITGHVPFEGESLGEVLMKHLTAQPDLAQIADPYRTAIARALAKDADSRPHNVTDFMSLLPRPLHATLASLGPVPLPPPLAKDQLVRGVAEPFNASPFNGVNNTFDGLKAAGPQAGALNGAARALPNGNAANQAGREIPVAQVVEGAGQAGSNRAAGSTAEQVAAAAAGAAEEPIAKLVRTVWHDMGQWSTAKLAPWQRLLILLAIIFGIARSGAFFDSEEGLIGALIKLGFVYLIYRFIWSIMQRRERRQQARSARYAPQVTPVPQMQAGAAAGKYPPRYESPTWQRWRQKPPTPLAPPQSRRERLADLSGAMILSALVALVISFLAAGYHVSSNNQGALDVNQYAWFALTAVLGSWSIMIPAKLWDGRTGDAALRRFVMLIVGLGVGAIAFCLQAWLLAPLHYNGRAIQPHLPIAESFYSAGGSASAFAFVAYFGLLWLLPRWWRQADSGRGSRISLWTAAVMLFCALIVNCVAPFPQPWGAMVAVTVSLAVQLASAWRPKKLLAPAE